MSMRYPAGIVTASYFPLKVPNAPTIGTASVASGTSVSVTFTAPSNVGGGAITSYVATALKTSDGTTVSGTGASSPVTISGLTTDVAYTVTVAAVNAFGAGPSSAASNSVTPVVQGQQAYTTAGTYSWVAPTGVTSVSVVAVGGGAAGNQSVYGPGAGGGLGYKNNISVTPGNSYTVVVGSASTSSYFNSTSTVRGRGASAGTPGGYDGDGGGSGGSVTVVGPSGGGGAGGYAGSGGAGGGGTNGSAGSGGGGGGGGAGNAGGGGGGGVGILGQGSSGAGGIRTPGLIPGTGGGGGSSGSAGATGGSGGGGGGLYGGGGGDGTGGAGDGAGGSGAVRIIWPGTTRSFPSTNTGNL